MNIDRIKNSLPANFNNLPTNVPVMNVAQRPVVAEGMGPRGTGESARDNYYNSYRILRPNLMPCMRAVSNAAQSIPVTTWTKVLLQVENYDVGENFTNSKFTAPVNGYYQIFGSVEITGIANAKQIFVGIAKNGVTGSLACIDTSINGSGASARLIGNPCTILKLIEGDYIELYVYQTDASSRNTRIEEATFLNIIYVLPS